jgi:hypothetical protein
MIKLFVTVVLKIFKAGIFTGQAGCGGVAQKQPNQ